MARLFTKQGICAYIAKEKIPYKPYIELRKTVPNFEKDNNYFYSSFFRMSELPAKISNHPREYCLLFGCCKALEGSHFPFSMPVPFEKLTDEDNNLLYEIMDDAYLDPVSSLADFESLLTVIDASTKKPDWHLVRVLCKSDEHVYTRQMEKYNQLFDKELDALIADKKVLHLAEDIYRLPRTIFCEDEIENESTFTEVMWLDRIGELVSESWGKKNGFRINALTIHNYGNLINKAIREALYREELLLHNKNTWKTIEYDHKYHDSYDILYWHEVRNVLRKKGIAFPDYKSLSESLKTPETESMEQETGADGEMITRPKSLEGKRAVWHLGFKWLLPIVLMDQYIDVTNITRKEITMKILTRLTESPKFLYDDKLNEGDKRNIIILSKNFNISCINYAGISEQISLASGIEQKYGSTSLKYCNEDVVCNKEFQTELLNIPEIEDHMKIYKHPKKDFVLNSTEVSTALNLWAWRDVPDQIPDEPQYKVLKISTQVKADEAQHRIRPKPKT